MYTYSTQAMVQLIVVDHELGLTLLVVTTRMASSL